MTLSDTALDQWAALLAAANGVTLAEAEAWAEAMGDEYHLTAAGELIFRDERGERRTIKAPAVTAA